MELSRALEATPTAERDRYDRGAGALHGSRCRRCGETSWPGRAICNSCGSADVAAESFARTGTLLTYASVWVPRPGLEAGYVLGLVELDNGPSVFTHVRDLPDGTKVPLAVELELAEPDRVPPFCFRPLRAGDD